MPTIGWMTLGSPLLVERHLLYWYKWPKTMTSTGPESVLQRRNFWPTSWYCNNCTLYGKASRNQTETLEQLKSLILVILSPPVNATSLSHIKESGKGCPWFQGLGRTCCTCCVLGEGLDLSWNACEFEEATNGLSSKPAPALASSRPIRNRQITSLHDI